MTLGTALLLYLVPGVAYAGACVAMAGRDGVRLRRFVIWYQAAQIAVYWPLVGAGQCYALARGWLRRRGYGRSNAFDSRLIPVRCSRVRSSGAPRNRTPATPTAGAPGKGVEMSLGMQHDAHVRDWWWHRNDYRVIELTDGSKVAISPSAIAQTPPALLREALQRLYRQHHEAKTPATG